MKIVIFVLLIAQVLFSHSQGGDWSNIESIGPVEAEKVKSSNAKDFRNCKYPTSVKTMENGLIQFKCSDSYIHTFNNFGWSGSYDGYFSLEYSPSINFYETHSLHGKFSGPTWFNEVSFTNVKSGIGYVHKESIHHAGMYGYGAHFINQFNYGEKDLRNFGLLLEWHFFIFNIKTSYTENKDLGIQFGMGI